MTEKVPSQCPECESLDVRVVNVPPFGHDRGGDWVTRADCLSCDFSKWID